MIEFNQNSTDHLSLLFFGGSVTRIEKVPLLNELGEHARYRSGIRSGERKFKNEKVVRHIKGLGLKPLEAWNTKKDGKYQTNEVVLKVIAKRPDTDAGKIATLMLKVRELRKQISTYYVGTEEFVHSFDSCVHHELCHYGYEKKKKGEVGGGVITGRLSGQKPNMLNQPKAAESLVKQHFVPRNGVWVTADFSQIEPVAQAEISRDPQLIDDILNGRDEHIKYLALKERLPYEEVFDLCKVQKLPEWDNKRTKIKAFTFSRKYGGGAKSIAEKTGLTVDEVKDIFKKEEEAYPVLMRYQDTNIDRVEAYGELTTVFGRVIPFTKWPTPQWKQDQGIMEGYKQTEVVNYPVQSTGSADLTLIMIGHFWRTHAIYNRDKYLLVNTVYDEVSADCKPEYVELLKEHLKVLTDVKEVLYNKFGYTWIVPVKIDIKTGKSWYDAA